MRLPRVCAEHGCPEICDLGKIRCSEHHRSNRRRSPSSVATGQADFKRVRQRVFDRDQHICQLRLAGCTTVATQVDHRLSAAGGGTNSIDNLQAACESCNQKKKAR